jgi:hypothetical protein
VVALGLRGLGGESREKAIYGLAHDVEHRDPEGVCARLFPTTYLDPRLARELRVPSERPGPTKTWEEGRRACERDFGARGEFDTLDFSEPRVRSIRMIPIRPRAGVTRAAIASVSIDGRELRPLQLVEYEGSWKVVFVVR